MAPLPLAGGKAVSQAAPGIASSGNFSMDLPTGEPTATGFAPVPDACCVQGLKLGFSGWKSSGEPFLGRSQSAEGAWGGERGAWSCDPPRRPVVQEQGRGDAPGLVG